jgi:hypothetical protein
MPPVVREQGWVSVALLSAHAPAAQTWSVQVRVCEAEVSHVLE